jgi:hypothetical protein
MARVRTSAQTDAPTHAKTAWTEYLGERSLLAERTANLKAKRLAAEAKPPAGKG